MELPTELRYVYDEATASLVTSNVGTASSWARSYTDEYRIWRQVIDEDAQSIRVVVV
jgi:hypothetical protein